MGIIVTRDAPLEPPLRRRLIALAEDHPGISLREIARQLDCTWGKVRYHCLILEMAGVLETRVVGRRRVCYLAGRSQDKSVRARGILTERSARIVAEYFVAHPGASIRNAIQDTGLSQRAVYHHVKRFVEAGLLERSKDQGYMRLVPTLALYGAMI